MNALFRYRSLVKSIGASVALLCMLGLFQQATAQEGPVRAPETTWLEIGELAGRYSSTGSLGLGGGGMVWPYIRGNTGNLNAYHDGFRVWIGAKNFTDTAGTTWEHKIAYTESGNSGADEPKDVYTTTFKTVCRFPEPQVLTDLLPAQRLRQEGFTCDEVNPDMEPARKIVIEANTILGVTMRKEIIAFGQEYHDNYHIVDVTLTNTGNADYNEEIELPDQTVDSLYLWWDRRWGQTEETSAVIGRGATWGNWNMQDVVRDADLKAYITWQGWSTELQDWNPVGAPAFDNQNAALVSGVDTSGQLHAIGFTGTAKVHADQSAEDSNSDPEQPTTMWWGGANSANALGTDDTNPDAMQDHFGWFQAGVQPSMADSICPSGDFAHCTADPDVSDGGRRIALGFGPYTLEPGQSVNIVVTEGVDGLSYKTGRIIGKQAKDLWEAGNELGDIEFDADADGTIQEDERLDKNEWVMTGRDSLLNMYRAAIANYESGYAIPKAPRPPSVFQANSSGGGIQLEWQYPEGEPDPPGGFEIYRTSTYYQGNPRDDFIYENVADLPSDARSYFDSTGVQRGINYYYYIQAVGDVNQDGTAMTPTGVRLKSNRYWTQAYIAATSQAEPGETLADARIVPNPYHVGQTSGEGGVRFSTTPQVSFFGIPGQATIKIFTERGDLVKTIEHTDGTGDETWDLQTKGIQPVVSGIYLVSIQDNETGDRRIMKLIVIR